MQNVAFVINIRTKLLISIQNYQTLTAPWITSQQKDVEEMEMIENWHRFKTI